MKKKLLAWLLAALALLPTVLTAGGARYPAPEAALTRAWETDTAREYGFSVRSDVTAEYEAQRRQAYEALRGQMTDEEIAASENANLRYPAGILCEAIPAGGRAVPVKFLPADARSCTLSLAGEILPALAARGEYTNDAFAYTLRFCGAVDTEDGYIPVTEYGEAFALDCPRSWRIEYVLPPETDNAGNPSFLLTSFDGDLTLRRPEKTGWLFDGWEADDGTYVETVPAGTEYVRLTARFSPRVYRISYVLTTLPGYAFNRVANDGNPKHYTYGEETLLLDVTAPRGYAFGGWYETADFADAAVRAIPADKTGDVILYARWLTEREAADEAVAAARWGDLDDDGEIGVSDARAALRVAVGLDTPAPEILARADFAKTGTLNVENARLILRVAVGLEDITELLVRYGRIKKTW